MFWIVGLQIKFDIGQKIWIFVYVLDLGQKGGGLVKVYLKLRK